MSRLPPALRAFLDGLLQPSWGSTSLAGVVALLCLILCLRITPEWVAQGHLARGDDSYGYMTTLVARRAPAPAREVVILGSSGVNEAISGSMELERMVRDRLGETVFARMELVGDLNHVEMLIMSQWLPEDLHGLVVLEVKVRGLALDRAGVQDMFDHPRLALDSTWADEAAQRVGLHPQHRVLGNYFLTHQRFFLARLPRMLLPGRRVELPDPHPSNRLPPRTPQTDQVAARRLGNGMVGYRANHELNLQLYAFLVESLKARGLQVALLQVPRNPEGLRLATQDEQIRSEWEAYQADVAAFADEHDVPYWSLVEEAKVTADQFGDHTHIVRPDARLRFTRLLARKISDVLRGAA